GYLGTILARSFVSNNIPFSGIDIRNCPGNPTHREFNFYNCSITDKEELRKIFITEEPTHVVHFACTFNKVRNKRKEHLIDVQGSRNVLEACNDIPSVKQIIYSSSAAAYGGRKDNPEWLNEDHPLSPGKYRYGINKKKIEKIFLSEKLRNDLRVVILRICTVTGQTFPEEREVQKILARFPFLPEFTRHNRLQFLHEDDFALLMENIIRDDTIGGIYNLAPDTYSFVYDLVPDKKYYRLPKGLIYGSLWILWHLKIVNLQPAGLINSYYPVVIDPSKLTSRYRYNFRYSTAEAFAEAQKNRD
ncbi:MAG: NAD-dependent epimerase/dehydratase family protein, partial [Bacteroidales bacterium]